MKIGIICGKTSEEYLNKNITKIIPKKYQINRAIHTDVALAYIMKTSFPEVEIDIIMPKDISDSRFKKNDINIPIGYDIINAINDDPPVKKFTGKSGIEKLDKIYNNKKNKIFPSYEFMSFIWDKKKYLQVLHKHKIPISPTIFIKDNVNHKKLISQIHSKRWKHFIIKPIGGTTSYGVGKFETTRCLSDNNILQEYFLENNEFYSEYLVQELITGFFDYGEIKSFWIDGKFSYAVNILDRGEDDYTVEEIIDEKVLKEIVKIGEKVVSVIPKVSFNHKKVLPAMIRIDFSCCLSNKKYGPKNYFVNEIESDIAGTYINFKNVKYPMLEVLADTYIKKAKELNIK
jgi:glutathione synthase/RimK-type ligase-like ATP-grasp enzyme